MANNISHASVSRVHDILPICSIFVRFGKSNLGVGYGNLNGLSKNECRENGSVRTKSYLEA